MSQLVLDELRALRSEQTAHGKALATVQADLNTWIGNGKAGEFPKIRDKVSELEAARSFDRGVAFAISGAVSLAGFILNWLHK